jgi:glycosyltransferase involved in cell wall biosynthesis
MRICLFAERLAPPFDEGIKNYTLHLARALAAEHELLTLTAFGQAQDDPPIHDVPTNKLLLSVPLARRIHRFAPQLVLYVPTACATAFSFVRARLLKMYAGGAPVVMLAMQPRALPGWARAIMPHLRPDLVLAAGPRTRAPLEQVGCRIGRLWPGIDMHRFAPVAAAERAALRASYGLAEGDFVLLHVGHLKRGRNLAVLARLQEAGARCVVVGSTSTPHDAGLVAELRQAGVRLIDRFVPNIATCYQMADAYLFPVRSAMDAIDLPLSVLEAMACDLPVVTTRFGALEELFVEAVGAERPEGVCNTPLQLSLRPLRPYPGLCFVDDEEEMLAAVAALRARAGQPALTRALVQPYAWPAVAERLLDEIAQRLHDVDAA